MSGVRGPRKGKIEGMRDALTRLVARAGIDLTDEERSRMDTCTSAATVDGIRCACEQMVSVTPMHTPPRREPTSSPWPTTQASPGDMLLRDWETVE